MLNKYHNGREIVWSKKAQRYDLHSHSITDPASPESIFLPIRDLQLSLTNGSKVADASVKECRSFIELPWCKSLQINVL